MPDYAWIIVFCAVSALIAAFIAAVVIKRKRRKRADNGDLRFTKLLLHEYGCTAEENEYELIKTEKGLRISNYFGNWWDEVDGEKSRKNCLAKRRGGNMALYNELSSELGRLGIASWNGFDETDENVCDGGGFWLDIELEDGGNIHARGSNAYPPNYHQFLDRLKSLFGETEQN